MKLDTTHGKSRREIGSGFSIDANGSGVVSRPSLICGTSDQRIIPSKMFLRPKLNFVSLTVCNLHQYLLNGSEKKALLS